MSDATLVGQVPGQESRGGRGGLYPPDLLGFEKKKENHSSTSSQNGEGQSTRTVADALLAAGVFVLAPPRLRAVAAALTAAGITAQDVDAVRAHIAPRETDLGRQARILATVFSTPQAAREAIDGVAAFQAAQAPIVAPQPLPGVRPPADRLGHDPVEWARERNAIIAVTRVEVERKDPEEVRADLGVTEQEFADLLARGRKLRGERKAARKIEPDAGEDERRKQFRQDMRSRTR